LDVAMEHSTGMTLSPHELAAFERDGYLVRQGVASAAACEALIERARALVAAYEPREVSVFLAHEGSVNSGAYFLESGHEIRFFFEEEALDASGALRRPLGLAINKIGHALHELDPVFAAFSRAQEVQGVVASLGMEQPVALQSMYIFKQPGIGGEVVYHQDATYLYTEPTSVVGLWWALEDATRDNGCLWVLPGGHRGALRSRFVRTPGGMRYRVLADEPWPADAFVPVEVPRGSLVLLHGLLPHGSETNRSALSRHAYALHFVDGACAYPADNWLQPGPSRGNAMDYDSPA
jgi:phytanoyl-CoA hydroxylase